MKNKPIIEAFFTFLSLVGIVLLSMGMQYEQRRASINFFTWEIQSALSLNNAQTDQIEEINYSYYDDLSRLKQDATFQENLRNLQRTRDEKVLRLLDSEQKKQWMQIHCEKN